MKSLKALFCVLSAVVLLISLALPISAASANNAVLRFEEVDGNDIISVIIPAPENLTSIDFTLSSTAADAIIKEISFVGCDTEGSGKNINDISHISAEDISLIYSYSLNGNSLSFSGYFIDAYSKNGNFLLCKIILCENSDTASYASVKFSYNVGYDTHSISEATTYSLKTKAPIKSYNEAYPLGDANFDGKVTASDARAILRSSVGLENIPLRALPYCDADYSGSITASDARLALRISVGLENTVIHRFDISLEENALCENGGTYTFFCDITGKTFTMEAENCGHILIEGDCFSTGRCIVCNTAAKPLTEHSFNENGSCSCCGADKTRICEAQEQLLPLLDEINTYNLLSYEAYNSKKYSDFIKHTQKATKIIKSAISLCESAAGTEDVLSHLNFAYKMRYFAFASCMDENGKIFVNTKNCNTILYYVKLSEKHINYLSYLYE